MKISKLIVLGTFIIVSLNLIAQPGTLDSDFDADGKVSLTLGSSSSNDEAYSVAVQPDGKILVAGTTHNGTDFDFLLVRFNTDGSLDNTFGTNGIVITPIGSDDDYAESMVIQSDGKIVLAGNSYNGSEYNFAVVRYNIDGTLDNTFSIDGKLTTEVDLGDYAKSVVIQNDGKLVVGGYTWTATGYDFAIVRYNSDGTLDLSFDEDGILINQFSTYWDQIFSIAIQNDGKIVVAGDSWNGSYNDIAVARFNTNGTLDNSFSVDGKLTTAIGSEDDIAKSVVVQNDGKILIAGGTMNGSYEDIVLVRYNSDGSLDLSFDSDGKVITVVGPYNDVANSIIIQPDNKILIAGYGVVDSYTSFALLRYNIDGSLDDTFGTEGIVTTDFSTSNDKAYAIAIQPNGRIVAAGTTWNVNDHNEDIAVARYLSGLNIGVLDYSQNDTPLLIYPNPVFKNAVLEYSLENDEMLSASLCDINGKLIQSFFTNEKKHAGEYQENLIFNNSVKPGIYLLKLSGENINQLKKIIKK